MRNLLLSSLVAFSLCGCILQHSENIPYPEGGTSFSLAPPKPIFGDNFNSFLFKTNITVYGKDFSGLLVTKQMSPQDYRVIFTTELGMKLFDFEFKDTSFTLHYCAPQFNRPKLLSTIRHDIEILLMNNLKGQKFDDINPDKNLKHVIAKLKTGNTSNYYYTGIDSKQLVRIEHYKKRKKKITFTLNKYENDFPGNILIKHKDIRLQIELNLLKK